MTGYVKLWRSINDNPVCKKYPICRQIMQDLMTRVMREEVVKDWRGKPVQVPAGAYMISVRDLAQLTDRSVQNIRTALNTLAAHQMIEVNTPSNKGPMVITLCNWEKFQVGVNADNTPANTQPTHPTQNSNKQNGEGRRKKEEDTVTDVTVVNEPPADGSLTPPDHQLENDLLGEEVAPKRNRSKPQPILEAYNRYNAMAERCGLPQAAMLTPDLRRSIGARLREHGLDGWDNALSMIERSSFCRGENDRGWRASLTFMVKPQKFTRLISGEYGNGAHAASADEPTMSVDELRESLRAQGYTDEQLENLQ